VGSPFLADFHIHTRHSDGTLSMADVVDLYGGHGFGAIAITDHVAEETTVIGKASSLLGKAMSRCDFPRYQEELEVEIERAWDQYGMVLLPGFELTKNSISDRRSAHVLGIGVRDFVPADGDVLELCTAIRAKGGISVAAHPTFTGIYFEKQTYHLWDRRDELAHVMDAWEVGCGVSYSHAVAGTKLPKLASSDLHLPRHLRAWKTILRCERHPQAILEAIRRQELEFAFFDPTGAKR
jgi:hypothetical protein